MHVWAVAQPRFSVAVGGSVIRNFSPDQKFWAFGQNVEGNLHFDSKNSLYGWINYYLNGGFTNSFTATAIDSTTIPQQVNYSVKGVWSYRQVSLGWRHYFVGAFNEDSQWNLYGEAGFGLAFPKLTNSFASNLDQVLYKPAAEPQIGSGSFKRLTFDLAAGVEYPAASGLFIYGDVKTSLPTSDYPSPYFHNPNQIPFPFLFNAGLRILFGE